MKGFAQHLQLSLPFIQTKSHSEWRSKTVMSGAFRQGNCWTAVLTSQLGEIALSEQEIGHPFRFDEQPTIRK